MKTLFYFLFLFLFFACSSGTKRETEISVPAFQTAGVEQYFLPDLPLWANGSRSGACFRKFSVHFLDFKRIHEIYQLPFRDMLELQWQFNSKVSERLYSSPVTTLTPREEANLFLASLEQVRAGVKELRSPEVPIVNLILWEEFQGENEALLKKQLRRILDNGDYILLLSVCENFNKMEAWIEKNDFDESGLDIVSAEMLTPFISATEVYPGLTMNVQELLTKSESKFVLWTQKTVAPVELSNVKLEMKPVK